MSLTREKRDEVLKGLEFDLTQMIIYCVSPKAREEMDEQAYKATAGNVTMIWAIVSKIVGRIESLTDD